MELLKQLCEIRGVSGDEACVAQLIQNYLTGKVDHMYTDKLGNLIVFKKGKQRPKVSITLYAHMDEVGLIISSITSSGFLKFQTVGGIDPRVLPGKTVFIGENKVPGVIGSKAIHLQKPEQRTKATPIEDFYIDIGAKDKETAQNLICLGDTAVFDAQVQFFGNNLVCAKALDDRAGCAAIIELLCSELKYDISAIFTVQEEIGTRGAKAVSENQDGVGIVIETTTCADFDEIPGNKTVTKLGYGPAISFVDNATFYQPAFVKMAISVAQTNQIAYQVKHSAAGGNDAGAISQSSAGKRVLSISMPCRYLHSPSPVISLNDYDNTKQLVFQIINKLGENGLEY